MQSVLLRISGTVQSAAHGGPIAGATVMLGWGGHFGFPGTLKTTQAVADGTYLVEHPLSYTGACPLVWMAAAASGYVTSSMEDSRHRVVCTANHQNITITLNPEP